LSACLLEVAANSLASALAAQAGGAGRVELCANLELGGTTPSAGLVALVRERLRIPLYVLVRPRGGDFLYSEAEHATMLRDIEACARAGCDGVVVGALDAEGRVDRARCRELVAAAGALGVTFHRAFDLCADPAQALEDVAALGCERLLTSGQRASAPEGAGLIRRLVEQAAGRLVVMPGAGIDAGNLAALRAATGAREFHASASVRLPSAMRHRNPAVPGMDEGERRSDEARVRAMVASLAVA
jgi:copper homeostasis protein